MDSQEVRAIRSRLGRWFGIVVCAWWSAGAFGATFVPADGANSIDPDVVLTWADYGPATSYEVYFSTDFNAVANGTVPAEPGSGSGSSGSFDPYDFYSLNKNTTYYWRVDRHDGGNVTAGSVQSFTTVANVSVDSRKQVFLMPMSDGVGIYTELYLPLGQGPFPTIYFKTTYGPEKSQGSFDSGYVQVVQLQRGRGGSEGVGFCFISDVQDGYDAIEWIRAQPWSNGKIGGQGVSGPGIVSEVVAASGTDGMTSQWVGLSTGNIFETVFQGGAYREALVDGWFINVGYDYNYHLTQIEAHPFYDAFWEPSNLADPDVYTQVKVPGLRLSGWYDAFSNGAIEGFMNLQDHGAGNAQGNQYLIMGPWIHGITNNIGELTFPESCKFPPAAMHSGPWNAYWLKGEVNEVATQPHVIYWVMGDVDDPRSESDWNIWRTRDDWPPPATETAFYLSEPGTLTTQLGTQNQSTTYTFDPNNPVPTLGGNNYIFVGTNGPYDQAPIENRPDVLLYTSGPLSKPLEITGRIRAQLYVSSNRIDTDFTAKLTDVYPDGRSMLIGDGIIRARHRQSPSTEVFLTPRQVVPVEVDLWSTSIVINEGHRLRVAISSSNSPRFDVNPNTGQAWDRNWPGSSPLVADNTVHMGPTYPSHITLPLANVHALDFDEDGVENTVDNCPLTANVSQADSDGDGVGDVCDDCTDMDGDGYGFPVDTWSTCPLDNCPDDANMDQEDEDEDGWGDVCDNCPDDANADQADLDTDGTGDVCDDDMDGDGIVNVLDNCPADANTGQLDLDLDGVGDACDACPGSLPGVAVDATGCPLPTPGDLDRDGDVDMNDFGWMQACITGPGTPVNDPNCEPGRFDVDIDIDSDDVELFLNCISGANVLSDPECAD